jgi:hypothetical protein
MITYKTIIDVFLDGKFKGMNCRFYFLKEPFAAMSLRLFGFNYLSHKGR